VLKSPQIVYGERLAVTADHIGQRYETRFAIVYAAPNPVFLLGLGR